MIEQRDYQAGALTCRADIARPSGPGPHPAVLIAPTVRGPTDLERAIAERLARRGWLGVLIDLYGKDKRDMAPDESSAQMSALLADRALLRDRMQAALAFAQGLDGVDTKRIAIIGYCFGGLCALDLARTGTNAIRGVISFHGLFTPPNLGDQGPIATKVLALHGWDDPLARPDAVLGFAAEMTAAGADWQLHAYGHVGHAFTNPGAHAPGLAYHEDADRRSWAALETFLGEIFA